MPYLQAPDAFARRRPWLFAPASQLPTLICLYLFVGSSSHHPSPCKTLAPSEYTTTASLQCSNARAYMLAKISQLPGSTRFLHTSRPNLFLQQKSLPAGRQTARTASPSRQWPVEELTVEAPAVKPKGTAPNRHGECTLQSGCS